MRYSFLLASWLVSLGCDGRTMPPSMPAEDASAAADAGAAPDPDAGPAADAGTAPDPDAGVDAVGYSVLFASVFYPRCVGCHDGSARGQAPELGSYDAVVGGTSAQVPGMPLVVPGDAGASYLFHKVAGTHGDICVSMGMPAVDCGSRMPRGIGAAPLSPDEIEMVRAWIETGAAP